MFTKLLVVTMLSGCFAEVTTSVVPRQHETLTVQSGGTTSVSNMGWTIGVWFGFHIDMMGVAVNYAPPWGGGRQTSVSNGETFGDDGHHLRLDVDVKFQGNSKLAATFGYDTIRHLNMKGEHPSASGRALFAGITMASLRRILSFTLGGMYLSATSVPGETDMHEYIPGVDASGLGVFASLVIAAPRMSDLAMVANLDLQLERPPLVERATTEYYGQGSKSSGGACTGGYYAPKEGSSTETEWKCP